MSGSYKRLKGFADIYGEEGRRFATLESAARNMFSRYGFEELRTPVLESTSLFLRSIGDQTDVVQKEMFTFADRKERSMTMRPEATAGVMRAVIEEGLIQAGKICRFFTIGPMFRYERPQKGRMRQFHQINCECVGSDSPYADAEIICMLLAFLRVLGLERLTLKINSLGCPRCRPEYLAHLRQFLAAAPEEDLCADCKTRRVENPLRVLDCKQPDCRQLVSEAPRLLDHLCDDCRTRMESVLRLLQEAGIQPAIDHHLVRGLDYYMRTTFEVVSDEIGAQTAVAGGGRYNGLLAQLGGPDLPGIGFACGMERLALLLGAIPPERPDFYLLTPDEGQRDAAFQLALDLRRAGYSGEMNFENGTFKSLLRQASRLGSRLCLIYGPDEASASSITIKNMDTGEQTGCPVSQTTIVVGDLLRNSING